MTKPKQDAVSSGVPADADLDPAAVAVAEDEEIELPDSIDDDRRPVSTTLNLGRAAITDAMRHAPAGPGVYRMMNAAREVLYVGKAKNIRKRLIAYARAAGQSERIARMVAATASLEFVSTRTETEALLLEANLIKQLRPRFNVLMRDDKSFPYILITGDHWAPRILKHRGAQSRAGGYFGPFASASAVDRTINALERAFLIRSCTDAFFESRTRPCLLYQIKRCAGPCTGEIDFAGYAELVREAKDFLAGRSRLVKEMLAAEMEKASADLAFERAALYRDRLAALSAIQAQQGINPRSVEEADVFAIHQDGGYSCVEVFFFRTGQNWGNRAYFPRADRALPAGKVLGAFLAQFYDDKPPPRLVLLSEDIPERELLAGALSAKAGARVDVATPRRGEKWELVRHAATNAREALGRKLAETATQNRMMRALAELLKLPRAPRRIEVYDNSHIQGTNAVGAMIVAGAEGFLKNQYRKFNINTAGLTPGDDYAMMREVLGRRFKRLAMELAATHGGEAAPAEPDDAAAHAGRTVGNEAGGAEVPAADDPPRAPDLVIIDGGRGQLNAARETLAALGRVDVPLLAVAKGPDRDAGRETLYRADRSPLKLEPRDPVLYFIQRLRDEAHRFAIGSHRKRRERDLREAGLQEIPGIGPVRKRALLRHFGTLKAIERASLADLARVPGINAETARRIHDYFHTATG
jgi:excinuclease ABC subunit C